MNANRTSANQSGAIWVHASAVIVDEAGIVVFGPSGAGKSTVSRLLLDHALTTGRFARLVGDDKVSLEARNGRVLVRPHPVIAGQIERRGVGILAVPHEPAAIVRLAVRIDPDIPRLPEPRCSTPLAGVDVPLLRLRQDDRRAADLVFDMLQICARDPIAG